MNVKKYIVVLMLISFALFTFAATTGKISGRIIDAGTEQPLPGANVIVSGTSYGAAADLEGYYTILNVPPGVYSVEASYVGYARLKQSDVEVKIDLNTKLDFNMTVEAFKGQEVVVTAERPVVRTDISGSQTNISNDEISEMPVKSVSEAVSLQAGVEGLSVRGGDSDELLYLVDGMATNDQRSNTPYTSIPMSAVQEVQIQVGGHEKVTRKNTPERLMFNMSRCKQSSSAHPWVIPWVIGIADTSMKRFAGPEPTTAHGIFILKLNIERSKAVITDFLRN
jgi:hypothetical protein